MSRLKPWAVRAAATLLVVAGAAPLGAEVTPEDRAKLVRYLTDTREQVLTEAASLSDAQWSFKPAPDRWSVGEVVAHLTLAEPFLFDLQQKMLRGPAATADELEAARGNDEMVLKLIPDRTQKATAPEPLQPAGQLGPRTEVLAAFRTERARTIEYVEKTTDDLRSRVSESPLGRLDAYQWLLFIGAHTERHLAQLREVKAHPQFPR